MSARTTASEHRAGLEALGLGPRAVSRLSAYLDTLAAWSARINLTGARTPAERVRVLVGEVLPVARILEPGLLVDVGSGNGSPGLVLAVLRDDLEVTLLEPRARRWAFLREAARATGTRVSVLRVRHDGFAGPGARTVTMRAVGLPLRELSPLVADGGRVVVLGAGPAAEPPFVAEPALSGRGFWAFRRDA